MKNITLIPAMLVSSLLIACGGSDKGAELPQPGVITSSSSSVVSSSSASSTNTVTISSSMNSSSAIAALEVALNILDCNGSTFVTDVIELADGSRIEFTLGGNSGGMDSVYFTVVGD